MKTFLIALFVLLITAVVQPSVNLSYAQDNCTCAECGYACKTPMVHASNCKYKNNRQDENKSFDKSDASESSDTEFKMLMVRFTIKTISGVDGIDKTQKEKLFLEQKELLEKITPENDSQKLLYDDIKAELKNLIGS
ncbi:MAG: hypothetical protein ACOYN6_05440 [Ignavibacteria bacterium]